MPSPARLSRARARVGPRPAQRVAAVFALVADALSVILLVALVVSQPLYSLVLLGAVAAFLVCSLAAVLGSGLRRALFVAGAVAALVLAAALVVSWGASRGPGRAIGAGAVVLLAAGMALGRFAVRHAGDPDAQPASPGPAPEAPSPTPASPATPPRRRRRAVLFINPRSGGGKADEFDLVGEARALGVETVVLEEGDELEELARKAAGDGAEILGMAGGDGSQACVLSVAVDHDLPFVCVPSGTRNHFALDLGLDRRDPRRALSAFVEGEHRRIDYGTVNGRVFVNNVALGLYAAIVDHDDYRDAKLQTVLDLVPRLVDEEGPWFDLQFDTPEDGPWTSATLLIVSNNPYELAGGSVQRQRLDEGRLGVIAVTLGGIRDLVGITVLTAAGRPDASRSLCRWDTDALTVGSPHAEIVAGIDGETITLDAPLELAVVHCGAQVLVPAGARVGLDEQRISSGARFAGLLEVVLDRPTAQD
jgi:diacylglycerol kinase family enzyme